MNFIQVAKVVGVAAIAGFGGGFLWGVADHRSPEGLAGFIDERIKFDHQTYLAFSCGNSRPLVLYDLLADKISRDPNEISAIQGDVSNRILANDLFSHYTAFAADGAGVFFSVQDELKLWKTGQSTLRRLGLIALGIIPGGYLGYMASDWLNLECSSKVIYERLADKKYWAPYRMTAAKVIFDARAYCVDRLRTLQNDIGMLDFDNGNSNKQKALEEWRSIILPANTDLPQQSVVQSRYSTEGIGYTRDTEKVGEPTWGDGIYQRIYGDMGGFISAEADFDMIDFQALFSAIRQCDKIDRVKAETLYKKITSSAIARIGRSNFFDRKSALVTSYVPSSDN
jgi:hypothetical protein